MKDRKSFRAAALALALVMVLGLAACGGSGDQPQSGNQVQHSDLVGKWASETVGLWFKDDIEEYVLISFDNSDMYYGYSYTVEGNVLTVKLDDGEMELTVEADRILYGEVVFTRLPADSGSNQEQPVVTEPVANQTEPVQTQPIQTEPIQTQPVATAPAVSANQSDWYGVWSSGSWLLEIGPSCAFAYNIDWPEDEFDPSVCISDIWDGSYEIEGNTMKLDLYDIAGNLMDSQVVTLEDDIFYIESKPKFEKLTDAADESRNLAGTWYAMPDEYFAFGSSDHATSKASGDILTFYEDGTFLIRWDGFSGTYDGNYQLTTKFNSPAIRMVFNGIYYEGTYEYDFLCNDLLMIYTDNERCYGYLLYRN